MLHKNMSQCKIIIVTERGLFGWPKYSIPSKKSSCIVSFSALICILLLGSQWHWHIYKTLLLKSSYFYNACFGLKSLFLQGWIDWSTVPYYVAIPEFLLDHDISWLSARCHVLWLPDKANYRSLTRCFDLRTRTGNLKDSILAN